jgi:hypothetical protein
MGPEAAVHGALRDEHLHQNYPMEQGAQQSSLRSLSRHLTRETASIDTRIYFGIKSFGRRREVIIPILRIGNLTTSSKAILIYAYSF